MPMTKARIEKLLRALVIYFSWIAMLGATYLAVKTDIPQIYLLGLYIVGVIPYLLYIRFVRQWRDGDTLDHKAKGVKPLE